MLFIWDPAKAEKNLRKHGVSFEVAQTVFDDPWHISILDKKFHGEERWISMGRSIENEALVVVHLYKQENDGEEILRLISARKATTKERRQYEERI